MSEIPQTTDIGRLVDACLSPVKPIRDEAAAQLREYSFSYELIASLRWSDLREIRADRQPIMSVPGIEFITLAAGLTAPLLAWKTIAIERRWRSHDRPLFPHFDTHGVPSLGRQPTAEEIHQDIQRHRRWLGKVPDAKARDVRDAALLCYAYFSGDHPEDVRTACWGDLDGWTKGWFQAVPWNPRLNLLHCLADWRDEWEVIVGRAPQRTDALWISDRPSQVRFRNDVSVKAFGEQALTNVFARRSEQAGLFVPVHAFAQYPENDRPF